MYERFVPPPLSYPLINTFCKWSSLIYKSYQHCYKCIYMKELLHTTLLGNVLETNYVSCFRTFKTLIGP